MIRFKNGSVSLRFSSKSQMEFRFMSWFSFNLWGTHINHKPYLSRNPKEKSLEITRPENFPRKRQMVSPLQLHFSKKRHNDPSCPKNAPNSYTLRIERLFNNLFWVLQAPNATILLINVASEVKMSLIAHNDFSVKFRFIFIHFYNEF